MTANAITNRAARRLFLQKHGLGVAPTGPSTGHDLLGIIRQIGFVQLDSINTVARAHHMILHARRQSYRPAHLKNLFEKDRALFEHWTHDASIIPIEYFPYWKLRFERSGERLMKTWATGRRAGFIEKIDDVLNQIASHGPLSSAQVGLDEKRGSGGWWDWHPSKTALEYLWHTGRISVTGRENFRKLYDLTENVIPPALTSEPPSKDATIHWACNSAIDHQGFATPAELRAFWDKLERSEVDAWVKETLARGEIIWTDIEGADGKQKKVLARPNIHEAASRAAKPPALVRIISPFDPAFRDRKRTSFLFGFDYTIEIFVPEAKRTYGYYVFPVLEGDQLIGRIDMKADRRADRLNVTAFWPERGIKMGKSRLARLTTAIERTRRLSGTANTAFAADWLRDTR